MFNYCCPYNIIIITNYFVCLPLFEILYSKLSYIFHHTKLQEPISNYTSVFCSSSSVDMTIEFLLLMAKRSEVVKYKQLYWHSVLTDFNKNGQLLSMILMHVTKFEDSRNSRIDTAHIIKIAINHNLCFIFFILLPLSCFKTSQFLKLSVYIWHAGNTVQ